MPDTELNIENLKSVFAEIEKRQTSFAGRFYARLFELRPEIEALFKSVGMNMQGKMIIQAVGVGINNLENSEDLELIFAGLGKRHANYGVQPEYYDSIGTAFVETCKATFGSKFDDQAQKDWEKLFALMTSVMLKGAEQSRTGKPPGSYKAALGSLDDPYLSRFLKGREDIAPPPPIPDAGSLAQRITIDYVGEKSVQVCPMQTILEVSFANNIPHICECGGTARCSTCRVLVIDGLQHCLPRSALEERLAKRKGFSPEIRLACQARVVGDVTLKRLVMDDTDVEMAVSGALGMVGEEINGAVLFTDIWGFTSFAEKNLPYDVIHALNLLFRELGRAIDENDGFVDKYIGDNVMAIFGLGREAPEQICRNAVQAAFDMLDRLHKVNEYLAKYLGDEFRLGIGVAFGPMVTGEVGFSLKKQFTAIGDTVNVAARLETETRAQQADLIVSDEIKEHLMDDFYEVRRSFEFELKGKSTKVVAHEITPR